jgi:hypothetical protein
LVIAVVLMLSIPIAVWAIGVYVLRPNPRVESDAPARLTRTR